MTAVKAYVEAGHDINAVPKQIETFITVMSALGWAANREQVDIAQYLLNMGANPNVRGMNTRGEIDGPALFYASPEIAALFLAAGADPKATNADGLTRLQALTQELEWHEEHYDPEGLMADYEGEEIDNLKDKLKQLSNLFAQYE